jgi:hypothetical protein
MSNDRVEARDGTQTTEGLSSTPLSLMWWFYFPLGGMDYGQGLKNGGNK